MKKFVAVLLSVFICFLATGCHTTEPSQQVDYTAVIPAFESGFEQLPKYYSQLSTNEKAAYINILTAMNEFSSVAEIPKITTEQVGTVTTALSFDNPDIFWLDKKWTFTRYPSKIELQIPYAFTPQEIATMTAELESKISRILSGIYPTMTDYDKELYLHDYLVGNCTYVENSENPNTPTVYGALVEGKAICEGYSLAMKLLLSRAGINSYVITGTTLNQDGQHMWNIVELPSGTYHLDATWNDPIDSSGKEFVWHAYFNITDEEIRRDHTFEMKPDCTSTAENYYRKNFIHYDSFDADDLVDDLAYQIYRATRSTDPFVEICFENQEDFDAAKNALFTTNLINVAIQRAVSRYGASAKVNTITYSTRDTQFAIGIALD